MPCCFMAKKKQAVVGSQRLPAQAAASQPQAPAPANATVPQQPNPSFSSRGWRDPALILAIVGIVIAGLSALYSHQQAVVSSQALSREIELGRTQALSKATQVLVQLETELRRCLEKTPQPVGCSRSMAVIQADARAAAVDPILTTDYPLVHMNIESVDLAMSSDSTDDVVEAARQLQHALDTELNEGPELGSRLTNAPIRMRLALGANDLDADLQLAKKFGVSRQFPRQE